MPLPREMQSLLGALLSVTKSIWSLRTMTVWGMSMFNAWSKEKGVPTFGYDANADAVAAIADGYVGTISQHADVQAYLTLRVLRNSLDGVDISSGISKPDEEGNVLSDEVYRYDEETRCFYALNVAITQENYKEHMDSTKVYEPVSKQVGCVKARH